MTYNPLNLGSVANDGSGDTLRAGGQKINTMFSELYGATLYRPKLTADRTYYVNSGTGDNTNSGADVSHAFRTLQHAFDVVSTLDFNNHLVEIIAVGNYTEDVFVQNLVFGGDFSSLTLTGDRTTPANVTITGTSNCLFLFGENAKLIVHGIKFVCPGGSGIFTLNGATCTIMDVEFGNCTGGYHMIGVEAGGIGWSENGKIDISGGAIAHMAGFGASMGGSSLHTTTITGTPNFSDAFVVAEGANIDIENVTFSGSATGRRFRADYQSSIVPTLGASLTYLPGDQPGAIDDGSAYNFLMRTGKTDLGTISSGTVAGLDINSFNRQWHYVNNGAHTLAAPTVDGEVRILITNGASAGVITFSGFTVKAAPGDPLNTTNGNKFLIEIFRINSVSTYRVYALQ